MVGRHPLDYSTAQGWVNDSPNALGPAEVTCRPGCVCVHSLQGAAQVIRRAAGVCLGVCVHSLQGAAQVIRRAAGVCLGVCVHSLQGAAQVIRRAEGCRELGGCGQPLASQGKLWSFECP